MKFTSFDELQRELTKANNAFTKIVDRGLIDLDVRDVLLTIEDIKDFRVKISELWMSLAGSLYFQDREAVDIYGKKINRLSKMVDVHVNKLKNQLSTLGTLAASRNKYEVPHFVGELSAHLLVKSVRGYWTYAFDPMSIINDTDSYKLYYRVDLYSVKRKMQGPIPSRSYEPILQPIDITEEDLRTAIEFPRSSVQPEDYEYVSDVSIWIEHKTKKKNKWCYPSRDSRFSYALTDIRETGPTLTNYTKCTYDLRSFLMSEGFSMRKT